MAALLALDPGERRTGIALSDPEGILASPLQTHDRERDGSLIDLVDSLCAEHEVAEVVVGHAVTQNGARGESALRSERVAQLVERRVKKQGVVVRLVDERYSTAEAQRLLAGKNRPREARDAVAAALILQSVLDARRA